MRGIVLFFILSLGPFMVHAQKSQLINSLSDYGFENIAVVEHQDDLYLTYENNLFRFESRGLALVVETLRSISPFDYSNIHILIRSQDIPMALVKIRGDVLLLYRDNFIDPIEFANSAHFSFEVDEVERLFKNLAKSNSSFYKVDLPVGINFDYSLGDFEDGFKSRIALKPRIMSVLGKGAEVEFTYNNIVQNDIPGRALSAPSSLKLSQGFRFDESRFLTISAGYLPAERFGFYSRFRNYLDKERFYFELVYGVTRTGYLDQNWFIQNNRNSDALWQVIFNYRWNKYDTDVNLTYGTFLSYDLGYKFQVTRQFNEVYFNLFYARTDLQSTGSFFSSEPGIIGFSIVVPFGQSKYLKPTRFRVRTDDQFSLLYRYSGLSFSAIDVPLGYDLFSDIREFYPEVLRKGLIKYLKP